MRVYDCMYVFLFRLFVLLRLLAFVHYAVQYVDFMLQRQLRAVLVKIVLLFCYFIVNYSFLFFSVCSCVDILIETETFRILVEILVTVPIRSGHTGNILVPTISTKC